MEYKDTINLPNTDFSMKANLPQREPEILKRWEEMRVYDLIMEKRKQAKNQYILHDGPPYSNGDIHMGHALNKILKDMVVKFNTMYGSRVPFVPGWDCHGLPVEHQLMKNLKIEKGDIPQVEFREKARDFALKYVDIQKEQFKRLGVFGDWDNPYLTLNPQYEGAIVRSFATLVEKGYVYKALKPVNWCFKCETALAEAEVEYEDHTSPSIYVKFKDQGKENTYFVIWTTTPWTLLANVAIAMHPELAYAFVEVGNEKWIILESLAETVLKKANKPYKIIAVEKGSFFTGSRAKHPFIERESVIVMADYVSSEEGTGCVHTAPGHGQEDYVTGKKYNLPTIMPVDSKGRFDSTAGEFEKMHVLDANKKIVDKLKTLGALVHTEPIQHTYPHCWRCKNPIIFRATPQYFVNVDHGDLRQKSGAAIENKIEWLPAVGKERISAMVKNRPDWCLSRQRLWGVPIVAFYCSSCDELLLDGKIINHVAGIFDKEGSNAWFSKQPSELLPKGTACKKCKGTKFTKESDILDVWFESGVSHQAVLKPRKEFPADLYLEGSDQHRGWFQSALLSAMAIDGMPPYKTVLTHGFVVDGTGKKMSKSLGNVISPEQVMKKYGADILRIWVASCDYSDDVRLSDEILARLAEAYRKIRNTCRFMLGNLNDFNPEKDTVAVSKWSEIDKWALWRTSCLLESTEENFRHFTFHKVFSAIYNFCVVDMSSIYLDVLKDTLYTAGRDSDARRSAQSALFEIISILNKVMAPILSYTADEVRRSVPNYKSADSIHLEDWPDIKALKKRINGNFKDADMEVWSGRLLPLRGGVLKELEEARSKGLIGSALEAKVILHADNDEWGKVLNAKRQILAPLFIVSSVDISPRPPEGGKSAEGIPVSIKVEKAAGEKCQRCWNYSTTVGADKEHPVLCAKCAKVVREFVSQKKG
ncbi:MAG: isoleucine--tRNA ligase [Candidatus Omnitrophica bacterium]|nr:isoleucine--tRNA ligase [Candidatus Omnitrophota bacterium]